MIKMRKSVTKITFFYYPQTKKDGDNGDKKDKTGQEKKIIFSYGVQDIMIIFVSYLVDGG